MNKENVINFAGSIVIFFILLFVFAKWGPSINFNTTTQSKGEPMVVTGEGKVSVTPDIAKVSVGIEQSGTSLKQIQNDVNKKSQNLVSALKKLGIEEKDIKSSSYHVYPESNYRVNPPKITGYRVSTNYVITIRDFDKVNDALVLVTENGANLIGGLTFEISDDVREERLDEARKEAAESAKRKAEGLAKAVGISLGKIINVSESQGVNASMRYSLPVSAGGGLDSKMIAEPEITPGTTDLSVSVSLSFEVR